MYVRQSFSKSFSSNRLVIKHGSAGSESNKNQSSISLGKESEVSEEFLKFKTKFLRQERNCTATERGECAPLFLRNSLITPPVAVPEFLASRPTNF